MDSDAGPETELASGKAVADAIGQDDSSKLEEALGSLPPRWKNWVIRGVFTWLMIGGFGLIIYGGPLALMLTVRFSQNSEIQDQKIKSKIASSFKISLFFYFSDSMCSSKMFFRDH